MVQKASNWIERNKEVFGWVIAALIYGAGLYQAINQDVVANTKGDAVQQEQISNLNQEISAIKSTVKDYDTILRRIDRNVSEINIELKHKRDKGE